VKVHHEDLKGALTDLQCLGFKIGVKDYEGHIILMIRGQGVDGGARSDVF